MRIKRSLVLAFLLFLYIGPVIFISSYGPSAIPTDVHMTKDFALSTEYEAHEESITYFNETLPDDIIFYPDVSADETVTASSGELVGGTETNTYTATFAVGGLEWKQSLASAGHIGGILNFTHTIDVPIVVSGSIYIRIKGNAITNGKVSIYNYTSSSWEEHQTLTIDAAYYYYTLTLTTDNIENLITRVRYNGTTGGGGGFLWCDYAISTVGPAGDLSSDTHYVEGFNGVSDWDIQTGNTITTDGDIGSFHIDGDDAWDYYYTNSPSITNVLGFYVEYRYSANVSLMPMRVWGFTEDTYGGSTFGLDGGANLISSTTAQTKKFYVGYDGALESIRIQIKSTTDDIEVMFDYFRVSRANETGWQHDGSITEGVSLAPIAYEEDMSVVTDWEIYSSGDGLFSDGDLGYMEVPNDDSYDGAIYNGISLATQGYYLEIRHKVNTTSGVSINLVLKSADDYGGVTILSPSITESVTWTTEKYYISSALTTESITFLVKSSGGNVKAEFDYLYIGRVDQFEDTGTFSTDGNEVTLTADADGSIFAFDIDTTTTASELATSYYPFLALDFNDADSADYVMVETYDGSNYFTVLDNTTIGTDTLRGNTLAVETYIKQFWISVNPDAVVRLDWIKAFSIANYTVTQSGTSIDDVLYVSDGTLYCSGTSFTSIVLDYDPTLSFTTDERSAWTMTTSSGTPQIDFYVTDWVGYTSDTSGSFPTGTLTDFRINFTATANIEAIAFLSPIPQWNNAGTAILLFAVLYDSWGINVLLIFFGLCLIPISVIYLVKGGKDDASMDKVFYGLVAFIFGWALFLGGIFA